MMKIRYSHFWPGFNPEKSFFHKALTVWGYEPISVTNPKTHCDIHLVSVFPTKSQLALNKIHNFIAAGKHPLVEKALANTLHSIEEKQGDKLIWFTGENLRVPNSPLIDYSLSFDQDNYSGKNMYLPLWWMELNWFEEQTFMSRVGLNLKQSSLLKPRLLPKDFFNRKFACAFIGNAHPIRTRVVEGIKKNHSIDVFGSNGTRFVTHKIEVSLDYKFALCFENDLYPGYVTEKLLEAYMAGNIPLYWGDFGGDMSINKRCAINLKDFRSIEEFLDFVFGLTKNQIKEIYEQPFLNGSPSLEPLRRIFDL